MKIIKISVVLMIGSFLMLPQMTNAQFEGQIRMNFIHTVIMERN